jgi:hypothetical protein
VRKVQEFVGAAEIQRLLGVGETRQRQLAAEPDFPAPVADLAMGKVWRTDAVLKWAENRGRTVYWDWAEAEPPAGATDDT